MNKNELIPVGVVSITLLFYATLILMQAWFPVAYIIFTLSPVLVVWMVYRVVRYGEYKGRELDENEEWGYGDTSSPASIARMTF
jgi:hypothetical protein